MGASLVHQSHVGGLSWLNQGNTGYKPYHYVKGEARNHCRLDNTYILYMYIVVKHLLMQWMALWLHPYGHQTHGGGLKWLNQGNNWVKILPLCQGRGQEPLQT